MTEYEIRDLTASYADVAAAWYGHYSTWVMIFLTLVFGFCVVVYAVGRSLSRTQVTTLTVLYTLSVGWTVYGIIGSALNFWGWIYAIPEFNEGLNVDSLRVPWWVIYGQRAFWFIAGLAPIWFLWDLRRSPPDGEL